MLPGASEEIVVVVVGAGAGVFEDAAEADSAEADGEEGGSGAVAVG